MGKGTGDYPNCAQRYRIQLVVLGPQYYRFPNSRPRPIQSEGLLRGRPGVYKKGQAIITIVYTAIEIR